MPRMEQTIPPHADDAAAGVERSDDGRGGHDLAIVRAVAAAHAAAAAIGAGRY